jgi:glycerophosphoryl diester phosphodiesterase
VSIHRPVSRRAFLGGLAATTALASGCGPVRRKNAPGAVTVASLTASDPFYVAHRGGGGDWPEMTAYAYSQASRVPGIRALEISVCLSKDGVLVCSHDPTTARLTGAAYTIADQTWQTLSTLQVTGAETTKPKQPAQPFTRFDDVVDAYIDSFVLFVEPKVSSAIAPLMVRMAALGQPDRVVWKQPITSSVFGTAKRQGFSTWGYVLDDPAHLDSVERFAAEKDIDMLGAEIGQPDDVITRISGAAAREGKKTLAWPIRLPQERDKALALGCHGLMAADPAELLGPPK